MIRFFVGLFLLISLLLGVASLAVTVAGPMAPGFTLNYVVLLIGWLLAILALCGSDG